MKKDEITCPVVIDIKNRICPICQGKGKIYLPHRKTDINAKLLMAKMLRKNGYSIRQIADLMNVKSPNTIVYYLKKKV